MGLFVLLCNCKLLPLFILLMFFSYAKDSEARLAMFSRANCFIPGLNLGNESISWDPTGARHWLWTFSFHFKGGVLKHSLSTGWENTFRSAATHKDTIDENPWFTVGFHYRWTQTGGLRWEKITSATDCNLSEFF